MPHREPGEGHLIERCQSGDPHAWDALFRTYRRDIYRVSLSFSRNHEDAEDITGQVLLRLFQCLHTFRNQTRFRPWLFRMVYHTFLDTCVRPSYRTNRPVEHLRSTDDEFASMPTVLDPSLTPEEMLLEDEASRILMRAIQELPAAHRGVLQTYHGQGKSYQEIAVESGVPVGTVKSRLNRARRLLRERLVPYQQIFPM